MSEKRQKKPCRTGTTDKKSGEKLGKEMRNWPDKTDVLGSYTGMGEHREKPVQDVDDL